MKAVQKSASASRIAAASPAAAIGCLIAAGALLACVSGVGAQTIEGLDLKSIRARSQLDPAAAEAFATMVNRRGNQFRQEAAQLAGQVEAGRARTSARQSSLKPEGGPFDFDAMIAGATSGPATDDLPRLIAFASLSMPAPALRQIIADVSEAGGVVVFRGFPGNSAKRFTAGLAGVLTKGEVRASVGVDPRLFRAFDVQAAPTYVVTVSGFDLCDGFDCRTALPPHDRIAGNNSLAYALEQIGQGDGPAAPVARIYAARLERRP